MKTAALEPDLLLAHADWVRSLARALVRDPGAADDVEQEVWIRALESPPRHGENVRGWLRQVARNVARQRGRGEARRASREEAVARPEAVDSTSEVAERVALQREVAGQALALEEPYRSVVLLRYFEDLPPRRIATRLEVPVETVRTRLARGLAQLRTRMDGEYGDRSSWCAALAPLLAPRDLAQLAGRGSALPRLVAWIMTWQVKVALSGAVAIGVATYFWGLWSDALDDPSSTGSAIGTSATLARDTSSGPAGGSERVAQAPDEPSGEHGHDTHATTVETEEELALAEAWRVRSRLVDVEGQPLPGIPLRWDGANVPRWTGADGRWISWGNSSVHVDETLQRALLDNDFELVGFLLGKGWPGAWAALLRGEEIPGIDTVSGDDGSVDYAPPVVAGYGDLRVAEPGWKVLDRVDAELETGERERLWILARTRSVRGRVVDPDGQPVTSAHIHVYESSEGLDDFPWPSQPVSYPASPLEPVDEDGRFAIEGVCIAPGIRVTATAHRHTEQSFDIDDVPEHDELVFTIEPWADDRYPKLTGRVVDPGGSAVEGAEVRFGQDSARTDALGAFEIDLTVSPSDDTSLLAWKGSFAAYVREGFGAELDADRSRGLDLYLVLPGPPLEISGRALDASGDPLVGWTVDLWDGTAHGNIHRYLEQSIAGQFEPIRTDGDGAFEIGGLSDRDYVLRAFDPKTYTTILSEPIAAGASDVVLRLEGGAIVGELRGRVVDRDGNPQVGAEVALGNITYRHQNGQSWTSLDGVETDENGAFVMRDVPTRCVLLSVSGEGIDLESFTVDELDLQGEIELEITTLYNFRLELPSGDPATRFTVLDRDGERAQLCYYRPGASIFSLFVPRNGDGSFPRCEVDDRAAVLVLYDGDGELRRVDLHPRRGELEILRP